MSILATNILPLAAFKAKASEILNGMKVDNQPVVITQNGLAAAVLVPPGEYDRLVECTEFQNKIARGIADSTSNRVVEHAALAAELATRYKA